MGCDRLSRVSRAASLASRAFTLSSVLAVAATLGACAQSVDDSDPFFGESDAASGADSGAHPIGNRDAGTSSPDTSTGGGSGDAASPEPDAASAPDTSGGGGEVDTGGGGPVTPTSCPNSPIYAIEGLAELAATNPRLCSNGCAATECCYGGLVCVNL